MEETRANRKSVLKAIDSRFRKLKKAGVVEEVSRDQIKEFLDKGLQQEARFFKAGDPFILTELNKLQRAYQLFSFEVPESLKDTIEAKEAK